MLMAVSASLGSGSLRPGKHAARPSRCRAGASLDGPRAELAGPVLRDRRPLHRARAAPRWMMRTFAHDVHGVPTARWLGTIDGPTTPAPRGSVRFACRLLGQAKGYRPTPSQCVDIAARPRRWPSPVERVAMADTESGPAISLMAWPAGSRTSTPKRIADSASSAPPRPPRAPDGPFSERRNGIEASKERSKPRGPVGLEHSAWSGEVPSPTCPGSPRDRGIGGSGSWAGRHAQTVLEDASWSLVL